MKRFFNFFLVVFLICFCTAQLSAKKRTFTGRVTYKITYQGNNLNESILEMMPKTMTLLIGENKTKTILYTQMGNQSAIYNLENKSKVSLVDILGQKFAIKNTYDELKEEQKDQPEVSVEILDETVIIAGLECKKVKLILKNRTSGKETESFAWFTEELNVHEDINFSMSLFSQISGLLMKYEMDTGNDIIMKFEATAVEKKRIAKKEFEIPGDYQEVTKEEMMKKFGG